MATVAAKVVLIGDSGVGKTALFNRLQDQPYNEALGSTVGGSFARVRLPRQGRLFDINLWDTAGQERFRGIVPMYFSRAHVVMLCYDITNQESYNSLKEWAALAHERAPPEVQLMLLGCKSDLEERRVVQPDALTEAKFTVGADSALEVSARIGEGLDLLKDELGRLLGAVAIAVDVGANEGTAVLETTADDKVAPASRPSSAPGCAC